MFLPNLFLSTLIHLCFSKSAASSFLILFLSVSFVGCLHVQSFSTNSLYFLLFSGSFNSFSILLSTYFLTCPISQVRHFTLVTQSIDHVLYNLCLSLSISFAQASLDISFGLFQTSLLLFSQVTASVTSLNLVISLTDCLEDWAANLKRFWSDILESWLAKFLICFCLFLESCPAKLLNSFWSIHLNKSSQRNHQSISWIFSHNSLTACGDNDFNIFAEFCFDIQLASERYHWTIKWLRVFNQLNPHLLLNSIHLKIPENIAQATSIAKSDGW